MPETIELALHGMGHVRQGDVLGDKYVLERELGRGAMGTVWRATHLTLKQAVAIKLVLPEHAAQPAARARFSTEAKAAARLRSRHVVRVYDDGQTSNGVPFIVMEYLEGESVEQRIDRERVVALDDAVSITAQTARALSHAHSQGVVHRDLKPANIYLGRSEEDERGWLVKVLDFGIAKLYAEEVAGPITSTGMLLGTPLFMSPEQIRNPAEVDHRTDLYSLGMCFYRMVTGELAFGGGSFAEILIAISMNPLPDLRAKAPWLPAALGTWFERCCAREPADRFQSAEELAVALRRAAAQHAPADASGAGPSGTLRTHPAAGLSGTKALGAIASLDVLPAEVRGHAGVPALPRQPEPGLPAHDRSSSGDAGPSHARPSSARYLWLVIPGALVFFVLALTALVVVVGRWRARAGVHPEPAASSPPSLAAPARPEPAPPAPVVAPPVATPPASLHVPEPAPPPSPVAPRVVPRANRSRPAAPSRSAPPPARAVPERAPRPARPSAADLGF